MRLTTGKEEADLVPVENVGVDSLDQLDSRPVVAQSGQATFGAQTASAWSRTRPAGFGRNA